MRISDNFIAIDTEYHTDKLGIIDNVYCVCCTNNENVVYKKWVSDKCDENILKEIAQYYNIEKPIFICHALDKAERRSLKFLGVNVLEYDFICTWHLANMLQKSFSKKSDNMQMKHKVFANDIEVIEESNKNKLKKSKSLSYAGLCKSLLNVNIDCDRKNFMRKLCIENTTDNYEDEIMEYCADDTKYLMPLLQKLSSTYYRCLYKSFCPLRPGIFNNIKYEDCFKYLVQQSRSILLFGEIADKGLPVDIARCEKVRKNAHLYREQSKASFNEKYPGSYTLKNGIYSENTAKTQKYISECIKALKCENSYPKSIKTGKYSMSSDTLKDYFKDRDCFGEHYRLLNKLTRLLNIVAKQDDSPFNYIVDGNLWYESLKPYESITSRCQPSTKRFIFGWHKSLYGIMNPPKGKWLVELDYGSEETFVQACICKDSIYNEIYNSKDIYLSFANKMRLVPDDDWNSLSKDELKDKYEDVRSRIKGLILGLSYGMGSSKLSKRLGIDIITAERYTAMFKNILHKSTKYKSQLSDIADSCNAFSLPDGFICKTDKYNNNHTTIGNWPFQSSGGAILRVLVKKLYTEGLLDRVRATIHDAIFFEVNEGDYATIEKIANIMKESANKVLNAPEDWTIKVGKPDIIKNGDIWCADKDTYVDQFKELLNFKS